MHLDRSPSLALYEDHVHCYACDYNASHWGFLRDWKFSSLAPKGWKEAAELLGVVDDRQPRRPPPPPLRFTARQRVALVTLVGVSRRYLQRDHQAQAYLVARGLGQWWRLGWGYIPWRSRLLPHFCQVFGREAGTKLALQLGVAGDWAGALRPNRLRGRIIIPALRHGAPIWYQARSIDPHVPKRLRYLSPPRVAKEFVGSHTVHGPTIVVEGAFDAAPLWLAGHSAIALAGVSASPERLDELALILRPWPTLLALDNDETGRAKAPVLQHALAERGVSCQLLPIPDPYKDVSAYLLEHAVTTLHATLANV
jgi:hypothetical protein